MKLAVILSKLKCAIAVLGFLGVFWLPVIIQENVPPSVRSKILPYAPKSDKRRARIETFKKLAPALIKQFSSFTYANNHGEIMPYRLFAPHLAESGQMYPLVVFLHGASGSGTDNEKQLLRANWFGGLVWAFPENQDRFPCLLWLLRPMSTGPV